MKIREVQTRSEVIELSRPYTIAYATRSEVELFFVTLVGDDGTVGVGSASPSEKVTGESVASCRSALEPAGLDWLVGAEVGEIGTLCRRLRRELPRNPAARAALDIALHDLLTRSLGVSLVDYLGRCHDGLLTSVTVGITSVEQTLEDARSYLSDGFRCLKIKLGQSYEEDERRLHALREAIGGEIPVRVDANQGYDVAETLRLGALAERLDLELLEQPLPKDRVDLMRGLPDGLRARIAADESLQSEADALSLAAPEAACGIFNIKLMKSGGVSPGRALAAIGEAGGRRVMWGCNDESVVSIAAALHVAYASPGTAFLDLDGSLELSRDPARGGFEIRDGRMFLTGGPGLGVTLAD